MIFYIHFLLYIYIYTQETYLFYYPLVIEIYFKWSSISTSYYIYIHILKKHTCFIIPWFLKHDYRHLYLTDTFDMVDDWALRNKVICTWTWEHVMGQTSAGGSPMWRTLGVSAGCPGKLGKELQMKITCQVFKVHTNPGLLVCGNGEIWTGFTKLWGQDGREAGVHS